MSNIIQIKTGNGKPEGKLTKGELGYDLQNKKLYVGNGKGVEVAGGAMELPVGLTYNKNNQLYTDKSMTSTLNPKTKTSVVTDSFGTNLDALLSKKANQTEVTELRNSIDDLSLKPIRLTNVRLTKANFSESPRQEYRWDGWISNNNIMPSSYVEVIFSERDAISGNYSPTCESQTKGAYIHCNVPPDILTIPLVIIWR